MMKIRALIIDDESLARQLIRNYLEGNPHVVIAGECENGFEALKLITEVRPDLLLLDIQMPKIDGFELLEVLDPVPEVIFTTAYDQYAIRAFERNAADYLLKPFSKARFDQALEKAVARITGRSGKGGEAVTALKIQLEQEKELLDRIIVRQGSKLHVIGLDQVRFIESAGDYVMVHADCGRFLKEKTMKFYEEHLPAGEFLRIHRSAIVNIARLAALEPYGKDTHLAVLKTGEKLKVSVEGYKRLRERL